MIRHEDPDQLCLSGFEKFFGIALDKQNRWIKLSEVLLWDEFTKAYCQNMSSKRGRPAKTARLVVENQKKSHGGKLIIDATVAEQAIRFPTDLEVLNEAREVSVSLIDTLYPLSNLTKKPRTYRQKARKAYLALAKQRNPKKNYIGVRP